MDSEQVQEYLFNQFQYKLFSKRDIDMSKIQMDNKHLNTVLNRLVKQKILLSFDFPGIYQFAKWEEFFGQKLTINQAGTDELLNYLYLQNDNGYYYGSSLLERLDLSNQIPQKLFIGTNKVSRLIKKKVNNFPVVVTPSSIVVNRNNKPLLEVLDTILMPGILPIDGQLSDRVLTKMADYCLSNAISNNQIRDVFLSYSGNKLKKLIRSGIYETITVKSISVPALSKRTQQ